jgi:hypothetical protein
MPFSATKTLSKDEWQRVFAKIFKPPFEFLGFECVRSDVRTGSILKDIMAHIHDASVILADLTDSRPNVFYELGIAHALTSRVVMVSQRIDECPSDLRTYGIIPYHAQPTHDDTITFQNDLREALLKINGGTTPTGPVEQYLGKTMQSLEQVIAHPVAIMRCIKCGRVYEVNPNQTTQSDYGVDEVAFGGKRTNPVGIEHQTKGLCGHWEAARFMGLKNVNSMPVSAT